MASYISTSLQSLKSHDSDVTSCDFGTNFTLASVSSDKTVRVWEWQLGKGYVEQSFSPIGSHTYGVTDARFSPQGTMLATSSIDGSTVLWSIRTGFRLHTFIQPNGNAVRVCRFTPDSTQLVTAGDDGTICIWNLAHRSLVRNVRGHEETVQALSIAPNSSILASGCSQGVLHIVDFDGNQLASQDAAHDLGITGADFSPVSQSKQNGCKEVFILATCGHDHLVKLWLVKCGKFNVKLEALATLSGHSSTVLCVRFNSAGSLLASGSLDKTVRIWEVSGKCVKILEGHDRYIVSCAFSRDGALLATGSNDKTIKIWDISGKLSLDSEFVPFSRSSIEKHANGNEVSKQVDDDLGVSDAKLLQRLACGSAVNGCSFSSIAAPSYQLAVATGKAEGTQPTLKTLLNVKKPGKCDKLLRVWHDESGRFKEMPFSPIEAHRYSVNKVEWSPDGSLISSCSLDGTAALWSSQDGTRSHISLQSSGTGVRACRFSKDGQWVVTGGDDEKAVVWSLPSGALRGVLTEHTDAIAGAAFSPDSCVLATCDLVGTINVWHVESLKCLIAIKSAHDLGTQSCDFSPTEGLNKGDKYLLASGGNDSMVKLWRVEILQGPKNPTQVHCLEGHGGNVTSVRFAQSGQLLASAASDKTARVWNVYQGECLFVLETHSSIVTCCSFSPDGALLATGSLDKSVIVWQLPKAITIRSLAEERLRQRKTRVENWTAKDIGYWLTWLDLPEIPPARYQHMTGEDFRHHTVSDLAHTLGLSQECDLLELKRQVFWLLREEEFDGRLEDLLCDGDTHELLCPITQELLREPVLCADGFSYERAAIDEWFLAGKLSSPMTNLPLPEASYVPNKKLRSEIFHLIFGEPK